MSTIILATGQLSLLLLDDINSLSLTSFLIGSSYGAVYGTMPAIVADTFGSNNFATTWALLGTGPITVFLTLSRYFGSSYDKQSEYVDDGAGNLLKVCLKGKLCYDGVFSITFVTCLGLIVSYNLLIFFKRQKRSEYI